MTETYKNLVLFINLLSISLVLNLGGIRISSWHYWAITALLIVCWLWIRYFEREKCMLEHINRCNNCSFKKAVAEQAIKSQVDAMPMPIFTETPMPETNSLNQEKS